MKRKISYSQKCHLNWSNWSNNENAIPVYFHRSLKQKYIWAWQNKRNDGKSEECSSTAFLSYFRVTMYVICIDNHRQTQHFGILYPQFPRYFQDFALSRMIISYCCNHTPPTTMYLFIRLKLKKKKKMKVALIRSGKKYLQMWQNEGMTGRRSSTSQAITSISFSPFPQASGKSLAV